MILNDELIQKLKLIKNSAKQSELASYLIYDTPIDVLLKKADDFISIKDFKALSIITKPAIRKYSKSTNFDLKKAFISYMKPLTNKLPAKIREEIVLEAYRKLDGNVGEFCFQVLSKGENLTKSEETTIEIHFMKVAKGNVNKVIKCINKYCSDKNDPPKKVKEFFLELSKKLKIYKLGDLIGPWARDNYYKKLILDNNIGGNIIIDGRSGCGKSYLAKIIHLNSGRPGKFVEINKKLNKETLLSKFEEAKNGTLFLDEIDMAIPKDLQKEVFSDLPMNGILAASNRIPWKRLIRNELIEEFFIIDFFWRIKGPLYEILPIKDKERFKDLKEAIRHFWKEKAPSVNISDDFVIKLAKKFDWPVDMSQVKLVMYDIYNTKILGNGDEKNLTCTNLRIHLNELPADTRGIIRKVL